MGFTGYPDGTFKPDKPITAGEWAAMMYKLFAKNDFPLDMLVEVKQKVNLINFNDVKGHWSEKFCYYNEDFSNFIHMIGAKKAAPNMQLMRWQAIDAVYFTYVRNAYRIEDDKYGRAMKGRLENRPLGLYNAFIRAKEEGLLFKDYTDPYKDLDLSRVGAIDKNNISPDLRYHLMEISWAFYDLRFLGFLNGFEDNTIRPNGLISRIEAFRLLQSIYDYIDKDYLDKTLRERITRLKEEYIK